MDVPFDKFNPGAQQVEMLSTLRRGIADVTTAGARLKREIVQVQRACATLDDEERRALAANREDLVASARGRRHDLHAHLQSMRAQVATLEAQQRRLRAEERRLAASIAAEGGSTMNERFDKFTERARKVLSLAQEEATRFGHTYIGTEHLLLGLVREGEGVAAKVLASLGVELNRVRSAVEFIIGRGDRPHVGEVGLTPRAKRVIELAVDEARRLGHHYVGTEHLLLGLVREGEGIAAGVLESVGVDLEKLRTRTIRVLSVSSSGSSAAGDLTYAPIQSTGTFAPLDPRPRAAWQAMAARHARWEYRVAQVAHGEQGPVVARIDGQAQQGSDLVGAPLDVALAALGADGWSLAAVDRGADPGISYYIFSRVAGMSDAPDLPDAPAPSA